MSKRKAAFTALIIFALALSILLCSCTPPLPRKADFSEVLSNYEKTENKKAEALVNISFDASFNLNAEGFDGEYTIKFVQTGEIDRIANGGKAVADFDVYTAPTDKANSELSLIIFALKSKGLTDLATIIEDYFHKKTTMASLLVGYDGADTFNIKTGYYPKGGQREYQTFYAISQQTIGQYEDMLGLGDARTISFKDLLVTSDFLGLAANPSVMADDTASQRLDKDANAFLYSFALNNALLKDNLINMFEQKILYYLSLLVTDESIYESYNQIKSTVKGWFNIESTSVNAAANSAGKLSAMNTAIKLALNVPNKDLKNVVNIIMPGKGDEIVALISDIRIGINISVNEEYFYDADSIILSGYEPEGIFESADLNIEDREVLPFIDFRGTTE
jgi:hypothetical protein